MKKCKHCQSEIDSKAKICPNCRKKQGLPTWAIVLIVIVVIMILGGAMGGGEGSESTDNKEKTPTSKKAALVLEDGHTGYPDEYGFAYYIEGYVKNNSDKDYSYVQVEFTTYDAEGNTLGSCLDNNSGLEANGRWKFKAICSGEAEKIASYKFKEITKW